MSENNIKLAADHEDAYIPVSKSGIPFLILCLDGISFKAKKGGKHYVRVIDAIAWYEKELTVSKSEKERKRYNRNLDKLRAISIVD